MQAIGFELSKQFKIENLVTLYLNISVKVNLRVKAIIYFLVIFFFLFLTVSEVRIKRYKHETKADGWIVEPVVLVLTRYNAEPVALVLTRYIAEPVTLVLTRYTY